MILNYLDYVKVWTTKTDCGGLKHVFDDIFRFRKALDMIAYELLMRQTPKESTINEMVNVLFHWDLIMHDFDTPASNA